jgi:hypothetical protein
MKWLGTLFGSPPKELMHPVFGPCLFFDLKLGHYWEAEREVEERTIAVIIEGDETGPTEAQAEFYRNAVADLDALFQRVAATIAPEYQSWTRKPLPDKWREAFALSGITIPIDGKDAEPWDVSYDCLTDPKGHMFTVYFEQGQPARVSIDG